MQTIAMAINGNGNLINNASNNYADEKMINSFGNVPNCVRVKLPTRSKNPLSKESEVLFEINKENTFLNKALF